MISRTPSSSGVPRPYPRCGSPTWGLFRDTCKRYCAPAVLYLVVWAIVLVRLVYQARFDASFDATNALVTYQGMGELLAFLFAWVAAAANFRFLLGRDEAEIYGALPVTRRGLFLATLGATFVPLLGSVLVLGLLFLALSGAVGTSVADVAQWMALQALALVTFGGIAVFCLQLVGRYAIGLIVYLMANLYAAVVDLGLWYLASISMPSIVTGGMSSLDLGWASPAYAILRIVSVEGYLEGVGLTTQAWQTLGTYGLVGVGLLALSGVLFAHRDLERAGDAFAFRPAHAIVTVLFSVGAGVGLTLVLTALVFGSLSWPIATGMTLSPWLGVTLVLLSVVVLLAAETVMGRSVRAVRGHIPTLAATVAVSVAAALAFTTDLTGMTRYVPEPHDVSFASVGMVSSVPFEDEAAIESVVRLHQALIDSQGEASDSSYVNLYPFQLTYEMKDGQEVVRQYYVTSTYEDNRPGTSDYAVRQFLSADAVKDQLVTLLEDALSTDSQNRDVELNPLGGTSTTSRSIHEADFPALLAALEQDVREKGATCSSYYAADLVPSHSDGVGEAILTIDVPRSSGQQTVMMDLYLSQENTPHTYEWVSQRYGTDVFFDQSAQQ